VLGAWCLVLGAWCLVLGACSFLFIFIFRAKLKAKVTYVSLLHLAIATSLA
jgi:hypothetical protein